MREAARAGDAIFGTIDSWLLWNLTGGADGGRHVTDVTNASRTMLMDLETLDWDDELLALFGIPRGDAAGDPCPPRIRTAYGDDRRRRPVRRRGADRRRRSATSRRRWSARSASPPGEAKNTYGTGNFLLLNTGTELVRSENGLLTTVCYQFGDEPPVYALEGSIAVTGSAVQWLRDQLGIISRRPRTSRRSPRQVDDNGGVYFVPAFSGLFAPYWRSDARGAIVGLSRFNTNAHLARATLEAICYQTPRRGRGDGDRTPASTWTCSRSTAASPPTTCACRSRPTSSASR